MKDNFKSAIAWMLLVSAIAPALAHAEDKPRIWVTTDLMKGPAGDVDDDVCMAALLLFADHYTIEGIAVNANPHHEAGTDTWAKQTFIADYKEEVDCLNDYFDGQCQTDAQVLPMALLQAHIHGRRTIGKLFWRIKTLLIEVLGSTGLVIRD